MNLLAHAAGNNLLAGRAIPSRRAAIALASGLLFAVTAAVHAAPSEQSPEGPWAKGRVLVMPQAGLSDTDLANVLAPHGGRAKQIGKSRLYLVELPGNASEKAVANRLSNHPQLKFAELDRVVSDSLTANDPYTGSEWHLPKISAPAAWDTAQGAGVTIAVLDSGIDASHPDLSARLVPGWNFVDNNSNTADVQGHGTKVAGTAAATSNNGTGVASVAGQARVMPVRVSNADGTAYLSTIAQGLTYAADNGARVANVSFVVAGSTAVQSAAQYLKNKNGLVFVSAGNGGADLGVAPSSSFIVVSGTDSADLKASWSNYGNYVHLAAPGVSIYTTAAGSSYASVSGTSFSAPVTAGVAALVMSANPALTSTQVESVLFATATDIGVAGRDPLFGYGRVNAAAAVQAALATTVKVTTDTQAPAVAIAAPLASSTVTGLTAVNVSATDNVGVTKVELRVNGTLVATDTVAPFGFSWDSTKLANGMATVTATAYDAAGNAGSSAPVTVNVSNTTVADVTAPSVAFVSPTGSMVSGNVTVSVQASDNSGAAGITQKLYINGVLTAQGTGGALSYKWNTTKLPAGSYTLQTVATDAAGNSATTSLKVNH